MKFKILIILFFWLQISFALTVDLNTASINQLEKIKGIGPKKAAAIVNYRKQHGKFYNIYQLKNVRGFSYKSIRKISTLIEIK